MITLHLEARSMEELRIAACSALGLQIPAVFPGVVPERPGAMPTGVGDTITAPGEYTFVKNGSQEPVQSDKPRRAHRRVRPVEAPVAAPVAAPAPEPDPLEEAIDALSHEVDRSDVEIDALADPDEDIGGTPLRSNGVDNEMLKREVISSLADIFAAGNVKVVRHVLHKYGRGAKSFPEIDPAHFPEIKAALDRNEAA
jgi:hypothetical protein